MVLRSEQLAFPAPSTVIISLCLEASNFFLLVLYKIHNKFLSTIVTLLFHMWLQTFDHNLSQDTAAQPQTL